MKRTAMSLTVLAYLFAAANVSRADSIGVNFGADQSSLAATASAGFVPQMNWNNEYGASGGPTTVFEANGVTPGGTLSWGGPSNTYNSGGPNNTPNTELQYGYLDGGSGGTVSVTLSGISASIAGTGTTPYDVIVYVAGGAVDGRYGTYTVNGVSAVLAQGAPSNTYTQASQTQEGNYYEFTGITGTTLTITQSNLSNFRAPLDGFEVVSVPEPSSLIALCGLCGMGLLLLARRRKI